MPPVYIESLQPETYHIEVTRSYYRDDREEAIITLQLDHTKESDDDSLNFSISSDEIDKKIGYLFQVNETTRFSFSVTGSNSLCLVDDNGNFVD